MKIRGNIAIILMIFLTGIIVGSFVYSSVEGWGLLDSFYFLVMTATTIGYGDFVPLTSSGKILTIFFAFFGVAVALYLLSSISSSLFKKHVDSKVTEIKKGVRKESEIEKKVEEDISRAVRRKK